MGGLAPDAGGLYLLTWAIGALSGDSFGHTEALTAEKALIMVVSIRSVKQKTGKQRNSSLKKLKRGSLNLQSHGEANGLEEPVQRLERICGVGYSQKSLAFTEDFKEGVQAYTERSVVHNLQVSKDL